MMSIVDQLQHRCLGTYQIRLWFDWAAAIGRRLFSYAEGATCLRIKFRSTIRIHTSVYRLLLRSHILIILISLLSCCKSSRASPIQCKQISGPRAFDSHPDVGKELEPTATNKSTTCSISSLDFG